MTKPGKCCANCTSFDEVGGCSNAVNFIEPDSEHRRAMTEATACTITGSTAFTSQVSANDKRIHDSHTHGGVQP